MDTTAAAELGMLPDVGGVDGVGFWDSGDVDPSSWGGEEEEEEDDAEEDFLWERAAAVVASQAAAQGPPGRQQRQSSSSAGIEPPSKKRSKPAPPDEASPGAGGRGSGSNSGKGNSQHVGGGQGFSPAGGAVVGAGAVGRGRGTGSIFYKTKLCSRFRSGNCPYNTNCNFAHGMEELRKPPPGWEEFVASQELPPAMPASQSPSHGGSGGGAAGGGGGSTDSQVRFHKTRPCKKYFGEGNCPYGEKCNFLHDEQSAPRAVREARETAAPLLSTPKTESSSLSAEGPVKDALASNSAATASAAAGSITPRPLNWKTRLCNKWETTGQCPFGDKCHFAHGSDELQMYGGGPLDPNAPAPTISDSGGSPNKSPSETGTDSSILYNDAGPRQRQLNVGASQQNSSRGFSGGGLKAFTNWKGPTDISTIYGDWIDEEEEWEHDSRGDQESLGAESNAKSVEQLPLPHQQQNVAFFRGGNGRHISRQSNNIQTHGFSSSAKNGGAGHVTGLLGVEPG